MFSSSERHWCRLKVTNPARELAGADRTLSVLLCDGSADKGVIKLLSCLLRVADEFGDASLRGLFLFGLFHQFLSGVRF
jgi:hypothetical protein